MEKQIKERVLNYCKEFIKGYNAQKSRQIWQEQSRKFRNFWKDKIMNERVKKLTEEEMIPIIQILDVKGLRRTDEERKVEGAAFTNMFQPFWYEVFREIKENPEIKKLLNSLFITTVKEKQIKILNEIKEKSTIKRLTGESGIILNDFLFVNDPENNISALSLDDRFKVINFFELGNVDMLRDLSYGQKLIETRDLITQLKKMFRINIDNKGLCKFLYYKPVKNLWKQRVVKEKGKRIKPGAIISLPEKRLHPVGELINFRGMDYAPTEENGVIFLFGRIIEDLGIKIISIQKHFPDAEAIKYDEKTGVGYRIFIEFEYLSSDFERHNHLKQMKQGKRCDLLVCWEHEWSECPKDLQVIELKEEIKKLPPEIE